MRRGKKKGRGKKKKLLVLFFKYRRLARRTEEKTGRRFSIPPYHNYTATVCVARFRFGLFKTFNYDLSVPFPLASLQVCDSIMSDCAWERETNVSILFFFLYFLFFEWN